MKTQGVPLPTAAAAEEGKGRLSNNIYSIPGASHPVSIRDAAFYCVGDVLHGIDGGRAKIKDVIEDINEIFLSYNPEGWATVNTQKRAENGGFTIPALRRIGKAPPPANTGRWAMKPTFRVEDDELILIRENVEDRRAAGANAADDDEATEDFSGDFSGAGVTEDAADSGDDDDDDISDIETQ